MFETIIDMLIFSFQSVLSWFGDVMNAIPGAFWFVVAMIMVFTVSRLLLKPLLGMSMGSSGASDVVRFVKAKQSDKRGENFVQR